MEKWIPVDHLVSRLGWSGLQEMEKSTQSASPAKEAYGLFKSKHPEVTRTSDTAWSKLWLYFYTTLPRRRESISWLTRCTKVWISSDQISLVHPWTSHGGQQDVRRLLPYTGATAHPWIHRCDKRLGLPWLGLLGPIQVQSFAPIQILWVPPQWVAGMQEMCAGGATGNSILSGLLHTKVPRSPQAILEIKNFRRSKIQGKAEVRRIQVKSMICSKFQWVGLSVHKSVLTLNP